MFLVHKYMELSLPLILFITPTLIKRKHKFIEVGYVKEIKKWDVDIMHATNKTCTKYSFHLMGYTITIATFDLSYNA